MTKIIQNITKFLQKIPIIPEVTIIYSTTLTILLLTVGKILSKNTPLVRILIQVLFLTFSTHLCSFTFEDICDAYNTAITQESQNALREETQKVFDEMYFPHLENKNLDRIREEFINSNSITIFSKDSSEITPSDFYTKKNILIGVVTSIVVMFFFH